MEKLTSCDDAICSERKRNPQASIRGFLHLLKYNRWRFTNNTLLHHINPYSLGNEDEQTKKTNNHSKDDGLATVIVPRLKDRTNSWFAIKRFKKFGHKIKHLMAFDKREKQRIAMDGVLDKIPKDQEISDEIKNEVVLIWNNCAINNTNQQHNRFKRTPSLNESLDKYRKLFRSFNSCETKRDDELKLRRQKTSLPDEGKKISLDRFLSLPNFSSYYLQDEDSVNSKSNNRASSIDIKNSGELNLGLGFQQMLDANIEIETKDENSKDNELFGTMDFKEEQERFDSSPLAEELDMDGEEEMIDNSEGLSIPKDTEFKSGTIEIDEPDSKLTTEPEDPDDPETMRSQVGDSIQVNPRDLELFNHVRDVLELSGFGVWPSRDRTLEGRNLLKNPKCGVQLHIFDLINEVLFDIHQRSGIYWPRPLTSHCHVRLMPSGHHVLEEVWGTISSYLRLKPDHDPTLDYIVREDIGKRDGWMHLQFEAECSGLELEESMFEDLLDELMFDDLLEELSSLWRS